MKTITRIIGIIVLSSILFSSCGKVGDTSYNLSGNEQNLPDKLKGLEVYSVCIGSSEYVKVALLNGNVNSITETKSVGKIRTTFSTIIIDKQNQKLIEVKEILLENDSMIVCRK